MPDRSVAHPALWVPGKLMIAGEYAVMAPGGTCVAAAVGRLAEVWPLAGEPVGLWVDAYGQRVAVWPGADGLPGYAALALQLASERWGTVALPGADVVVHGTLDGQKVGLGTSAAVTVACLRWYARHRPERTADADIGALAREVHSRVQGGGSGYDVTTIALGGCVRFDRDPDRASVLSWPQGLAMAALFTGQSAPTAPALQRMRAMGDALDGIDAAARELAALWPVAQPSTLLAALAHCERALEHAAERTPGLVNAAVRAAKAAIVQNGAVARTSGAGGGDCVLACGTPQTVQRVASAWQAQGGAVVANLPADLAQP